MAELFTIGELSTAFGLSPRAIRFYEDQGLIAPERVGVQRVYSKRDRARLQLILRGKRLGFSLADIREFLNLYDAGRGKQMAMTLARTRARIRELEQQLEDITITLAELRDMEAEIAALLRAPTTPGAPKNHDASATQDAPATHDAPATQDARTDA